MIKEGKEEKITSIEKTGKEKKFSVFTGKGYVEGGSEMSQYSDGREGSGGGRERSVCS